LPPPTRVIVSSNRVAQITCPLSRTRPQARVTGAPSLAPVRRNRSIRPTSSASDPAPAMR